MSVSQKDANEFVLDREFKAHVTNATNAFIGSFQHHLHEQMDPIMKLEGASASERPVLSKEVSREILLSKMTRVIIDFYFEMAIAVMVPSLHRRRG